MQLRFSLQLSVHKFTMSLGYRYWAYRLQFSPFLNFSVVYSETKRKTRCLALEGIY